MLLNPTLIAKALRKSSNGSFVLDEQSRVVFWNEWMEAHSGIAREHACGKPLEETFGSALPARFSTAVKSALQQGHSSVISHSINPTVMPLFARSDKIRQRRIPHSITLRALQNDDGSRLCLVEVADMWASTQRENLLRKQRRELQELALLHEQQEAQARAIIENISDALVTLDEDDRVIDLNTVAHQLFQLADQDIIGRDAHMLFHNYDDLEQAKDAFKNCEVECIRGNGERFPAEVGISSVKFQRKEHRVLIVRDLTDRREFEESLFREKEFAQITLHAIHEAVITTDSNGRINTANEAACKLLRRRHEFVIDRPLLDLLTFTEIDHRRAARSGLSNALQNGDSCEMTGLPELRFVDGETIYVNGRVNPLRSAGGDIIGCVVVIQDVTVEKRMQEILSYQATHDELTTLINRREFERRLDQLLLNRTNDPGDVLLYLDLDQFKLINDNCGHDAGDQLLRQLTGLLNTRLRHTDTLARLGGDEFAALLPSCSLGVGQRIAEELRETVRDYRFNWEGRNFAIGVSIGLVSIDHSMDNTATVLAAADSACYIAKENGRDQVVVYKPDGNEEQRRREEMSQAARIRESLEHNRFGLYCQPIVPVEMHPDSKWGVEILVRMFDEQNNPVSPMAFIPAAERYNLMSHIDRWVIDALAEQWVRNPTLFDRLDKIAVNLSGQSVANDEFLEYVVRLIERRGLAWEKICFEITETAAVASIEKAQNFMSQLTAKGCRFALDDFGSGLSSFTYLKHLPVDYLKIDGAFVKDMLSDEIDAAMVRSISDIGRSMGLMTIAEFVEDQQIINALRDAKVHYAQGYGICKPMPLLELPGFTPRLNGGPMVVHSA